MTRRDEHECVGVYLSGDSVTTRVRDADLAADVAYNATFRPGRLYFVDGKYVCGGLLRRPRLDEVVAEFRARLRGDADGEEIIATNTLIEYLPVDAPAYARKTKVIVENLMNPDQLIRILNALHDDDQFEPSDVGLPNAPGGGSCRLLPGFADFTSTRPTANVTIEQLTTAFESASRNGWPSRARENERRPET